MKEIENHYQKGILVMNYLRDLKMSSVNILDSICDENLEKSYQLIKDNPKITKKEFLNKMQIEEED